jgi:hypothetical protein
VSTRLLQISASCTRRNARARCQWRPAAFPLVEQALSSIRANGNSATVELHNRSV